MTTSTSLFLFFVEYIKKSTKRCIQIQVHSIFFVKAGDDVTGIIGKEEIAKTPGLVITLGGAIWDPSSNNSNNIEVATEDAAKKLRKNLFLIG